MGASFRIARSVFLGLFLVLSFASYPLALSPPGLANASYYVRLPALFLLTLAAAVCLAHADISWTSWRWRLPALAFGTSVALHLVSRHALGGDSNRLILLAELGLTVPPAPSPYRVDATLAFLGYLLVPLTVACLARAGQFPWRRAVTAAIGLWGLNAVYGLLSYVFGHPFVGITGNRNWLAITLLALAPWAAFGAPTGRSTGVAGRRLRRWLVPAVVMLLTAVLMSRCASRAAWLALFCYGLVAGLQLVGGLRRRLAAVGLLLALACCLAWGFRAALADAYQRDIRGPLWHSTLCVVAAHPWLGVGAGPQLFNRQVTPRLAQTAHGRRLVAADRTLHPHNELLNVAVQLGVPAALAWGLLLLPVLRLPRAGPAYLRLAHFSAFVIVLHGLLDKPLVQPPSDLIGLCCVGICWYASIIREVKWRPPCYPAAMALAVAILVAAGMLVTGHKLRYGWLQRRAVIAASRGDYRAAAAFYRRMQEADPGSITGFYGSGALELQKLMAPDAALPDLVNAAALDPNYASLNTLLGRCLGSMGRHADALRLFERQCQLTPYRISAWQDYFSCLQLNGRYGELPAVDTRLRRLYVERTVLALGREQALALAADWLAAVEQNQLQKALQNARKLTATLSLAFADASLAGVDPKLSWPPAFRWGGFTETDYRYWRHIAWRRALRAELLAAGGSVGPAAWGRLVADRIAVDPRLPYAQPWEVWRAGHGSPLAVAALLAWLSAGDGTAFIEVRESSGPRVWLVGADGALLWSPTGKATAEPATRPLAGLWMQACLPQEFALRNQILGVLIGEFLPSARCDFDDVPSLRMRQDAAAAGLAFDPAHSFLPQPLELGYREIVEHAPGAVPHAEP